MNIWFISFPFHVYTNRAINLSNLCRIFNFYGFTDERLKSSVNSSSYFKLIVDVYKGVGMCVQGQTMSYEL